MIMAAATLTCERIAAAGEGRLAMGLRCPVARCGASVIVERIDNGYIAHCMSCTFAQRIARAGKAWRHVPTRKNLSHLLKNPGREALPSPGVGSRRPRCVLYGCRAFAEEGGLCTTHLAMWRIAGRPDRDRWVRKCNTEQRKRARTKARRD